MKSISAVALLLPFYARAGIFSRDEPTGDPEYFTEEFVAIPAGKTD